MCLNLKLTTNKIFFQKIIEEEGKKWIRGGEWEKKTISFSDWVINKKK